MYVLNENNENKDVNISVQLIKGEGEFDINCVCHDGLSQEQIDAMKQNSVDVFVLCYDYLTVESINDGRFYPEAMQKMLELGWVTNGS